MLRRNFLASFGLGAVAVGVAAAAPRKPFAKPPTSKALDVWRNALAAPFSLLAGATIWLLPETRGVRLMGVDEAVPRQRLA